MIAFILRHPVAFTLALVLHLALGVFLTSSWLQQTESIKIQSQSDSITEIKESQPLQTFAVDQNVVQQQLARLKAEEDAKRKEQAALAALAKENEQRLVQLRREQEAESRLAEEARRQADIARQRQEAERKRAQEEQRRAEDAKKVALEAERKRQEAEQQARKIAAEAQQQRLAEEKRLKELEALQRQAQEQAKREEERQKVLAEQVKAREAEKRQLEAQALAARLQQEQLEQEAAERRKAEEADAKVREEARKREMQSLRDSYISSISAKVRENWRTPANISPLAQCELIITQTPTGQVSSVKTENCNTHATDQFKQAAESAVLRAQPLPKPPVEELFERTIRFVFKP